MREKYQKPSSVKFNNLLLALLFLFISTISIYSQESPDTKAPLSAQAKVEIAKLSQEGQAFLRTKKFRDVERISAQIYKISANSPESYFLNGGIHYGLGDYRKSIAYLEKAILINPDHDLSLFYLGMNYFKLNLYEKSIFYLNKASESGSFHPFYRFNLAIAYYFSGNYEKARIEAEKTLRLKENYLKARVILIRSLMKLDKKQEALENAKEMYEKNQELDSVSHLYAELLVEDGKNYREAINILIKRSDLNLKDRKYLAYAYLQEGDFYRASVLYKQIVNTDKELEEDGINLLKCLIFLNRDDEAEKYLTQLVRSNPSLKKTYIQAFHELIEKRNTVRLMYQPIP